MTQRMTYEQTMSFGADQYRDVLEALGNAGLTAEFIQTGGMCAAIEVMLDGGYYLLITDEDDTLPWDRAAHAGWYVGLFEPEERRTVDGPLEYALDSDGAPATAVLLAQDVLRRRVRPN